MLRFSYTGWLLVAAVIAGAVATAVGAFIYGSAELRSRNAHLADRASFAVESALSHKLFYLQDVADMVGVHDDADTDEFSRYSRVRNGNDPSVLLVRWLRRSPSGRLLPPHEAGPRPILLERVAKPRLQRAEQSAAGAGSAVVKRANASRQPIVSAPIRLGRINGLLVAVPVRPHHDSGLLSKFESESVVVGLLDADQLVQSALGRAGVKASVAVSDGGRLLRRDSSRNWTQRGFLFGQRQWRVFVEPLRQSALVSMLPWLILAAGALLGAALAMLLRTLHSRGARAFQLADRRGAELAQSLAMTKRIADAIEERFYTYELLPDGGRRTMLMTAGWTLGEQLETIEDWERHVHPDDRDVWRQAADAIHNGRPVDFEFRLSTIDDERWIWARERPLGIVDGRRLVDGVASDVTKRKRAEIALAMAVGDMQTANQELVEAHAQADRRSRTDVVTGAFNRRHLTELLEGILNQEEAPAGELAVLMVDIDHFKSINDQYGHQAGDVVLREITRRISTAIHPADRLARWGGDEFVILGGETMTTKTLLAKAQAVVAAVGADPIGFDGKSLHVTASVGVALVPTEGRTPEEVISIVDAALYEAKRLGRNRVAAAAPSRALQAVA